MRKILIAFSLIVSVFAGFAQQPTTCDNYILTPQPPHTPRINGPKVFGVRPGHPFLFTIPATGDRPMTFTVDKLPKGLKVDTQTGQITGSVSKAGEYMVTFKAKNVLGKISRKFKIVCGDKLALTPSMGWSAWNYLGGNVTDKAVREAADEMVRTGLINHGYSYVNIDDCWPMKEGSDDPMRAGTPRDKQGNINTNKSFPDMKTLTDYIHSKGLKAGIYSEPGPATCGGYPGSWQHEEQDARQYAAWGFDYLKYDYCSYESIAGFYVDDFFNNRPPKDLNAVKKPYILMGNILKGLDRDMVFNICIGMADVWTWGKDAGGQSWRTGIDLNLTYDGLRNAVSKDVFDMYGTNKLQAYSGPGSWNDLDFLQVGYIMNWAKGHGDPAPFTADEHYANMSIWCLLASPLILGCDITRLDDFTLNLLTNDEVLDVNQDPLGKAALRVAKNGNLEVWAKDMEDGSKAVGLFNRGDSETTITANWTDLGLKGKQKVRDLWRQKDLGLFDGMFESTVPGHGVMLVKLSEH